MSYEVRLTNRAEKQLARLPSDVYQRMRDALLALEEDARPSGARKLQARDDYRLRVGDYRALYRIEDVQQKIVVTRVGHRRDIYR